MYLQLMVHTPLRLSSQGRQAGPAAVRAVSAILCSGTPNCGRGSRMRGLHESRQASEKQRPGPGLAESVGEEEGEAEAVRSAEEVGGTWMGVLKGWWQHRGASVLAGNPLSSESGAAASGHWLKGLGEVEVAEVEE